MCVTGRRTTPHDCRLDHAVLSACHLRHHARRATSRWRTRPTPAARTATPTVCSEPGGASSSAEARTMKPWRRGCAGAPCGLGPLCTRINPETAIQSNTGNSPCSLSVVNLLLRRKPARAAVAPAQRPRGSAFEPDTETRLPPRFRPGIAPTVGARIADGASVAQGILEFPVRPISRAI